MPLDADHLNQARLARREFLVAVEEHRPALYAYCRRLTGNVWDAEDLVQETLAKAFARAAETHVAIDNPPAWLARIATNAYIDHTRRAQPSPLRDTDLAAAEQADPGEVRDALKELVTVLPPQERAVLVLKDVFDYPLADIASIVGTTTGAVKSALHRGRTKLAAPEPIRRRPTPDRRVLEAAAAAFTAYDIDALVDLFLDDGVMYIVGMVHETGGTQMREGSFEHTFNLERDVRYTAEVRDFDGEPLVAIFSRPAGGTGPTGLAEVWRCVTEGAKLRLVDDYFFCPEVVTEVADAWDVPTVLHGYRYH
jgi:RNA polymerase sigma-70 factor (ECF subfamily)